MNIQKIMNSPNEINIEKDKKSRYDTENFETQIISDGYKDSPDTYI